MAHPKICKCGHMRTDHSHKKVKGKFVSNAGGCLFEECPCEVFIFDHIGLVYRGHGYERQYEAMFSGKYEKLPQYEPKEKKGKLSMNRLDKDGKPIKIL